MFVSRKKYRQIRIVVILFVLGLVGLAVIRDDFFLAAVGVLTGIVFMGLARSTAEIRTDEREISVQEKAARASYAIFAPTIGLTSLLLLLPAKGGFSIFAKGEWLFIEAIGMVLAYLSFFLISLYAISYYFFNKKFGGGKNGEK
jgi:uncharacterized membrane protein